MLLTKLICKKWLFQLHDHRCDSTYLKMSVQFKEWSHSVKMRTFASITASEIIFKFKLDLHPHRVWLWTLPSWIAVISSHCNSKSLKTWRKKENYEILFSKSSWLGMSRTMTLFNFWIKMLLSNIAFHLLQTTQTQKTGRIQFYW